MAQDMLSASLSALRDFICYDKALYPYLLEFPLSIGVRLYPRFTLGSSYYVEDSPIDYRSEVSWKSYILLM